MIHREVTMLKLNSEITFFSVEIDVRINDLEYLGWDFDDYYCNTEKAFGFSRSQAIEYCVNKYITRVRVEGKEKYSSYTWVDLQGNDTEYEATGDNEATINDIITLLNDGYSLRSDECQNENGDFVAFAI